MSSPVGYGRGYPLLPAGHTCPTLQQCCNAQIQLLVHRLPRVAVTKCSATRAAAHAAQPKSAPVGTFLLTLPHVKARGGCSRRCGRCDSRSEDGWWPHLTQKPRSRRDDPANDILHLRPAAPAARGRFSPLPPSKCRSCSAMRQRRGWINRRNCGAQ